ncbi:MAG: hypothetical protein R2747_06585 [Pyrinomonadaceae bacterium]
MKHKFAILTTTLILLIPVLGCSFLNPFSGHSDSGSGSGSNPSNPGGKDEPVIVEKTGVKECDELMDFIAAQQDTKDDNYVTKSAREFFFNRIREALRKSVEDNKNNPEELAKKCKEFKTQLETYKAREDEQKKESGQ